MTLIDSMRELTAAWDALVADRAAALADAENLRAELIAANADRQMLIGERDALAAKVSQLRHDLADCEARRAELLAHIQEGAPIPDPQPEGPQADEPSARLVIDGVDHESISYSWDISSAAPLSGVVLSVWPTQGRHLPTLKIDLAFDLVELTGGVRVDLDQMRRVWPDAQSGWEISAMLTARVGDTEIVSDERTVRLLPAPTVPVPPVIDVGDGGEAFPADGILRSGKTYKGEVKGKVLRFERNARDVTIVSSRFDAAALLIDQGNNGCRGITLDGVETTGFARGMHGLHRDVIAPIRVTEDVDGMVIRNCVFHDFDAHGLDLHNVNNFVCERSSFSNLRQGMHLEMMRGTCLVTRNEFSGIRRMAVEIQDQTSRDFNRLTRLLVEQNVLHGFHSPDHYSYGLSVIAECCRDTVVRDNWLNFAFTGDLRVVDGLNGMGIGIELGGDGPISEGNTLVMPHDRLAVAHGTSGRNTIVRGDRIYGLQPARDGKRWKQTQASRIHGHGNWSQYGIEHLPLEQAPPPPAIKIW